MIIHKVSSCLQSTPDNLGSKRESETVFVIGSKSNL